MTLSTEWTFGGFLQGLQASMMGLIGSLVLILVLLFVARWLIKQMAVTAEEIAKARRFANSAAGLFAVLTVIGFMVHAVSFATNAIPRTSLDGKSVYDQMKKNTTK